MHLIWSADISLMCMRTSRPLWNLTLTLVFADFDLGHFWKWSRFEDYLHFCLSLTIVVALFTYVLLDVPFFVEGLGLVALLTEAMLGLPQLLQNLRNKSTRGMR